MVEVLWPPRAHSRVRLLGRPMVTTDGPFGGVLGIPRLSATGVALVVRMRVIARRIQDGVKVGRVVARRSHARLSAVFQNGQSGPHDAVQIQVGSATVRPLRLSDRDNWVESMRANAARMLPWWAFEGDWEEATSPEAFYDHCFRWMLAARRRAGRAYAIADSHGLVGEMHVYYRHEGAAAEVGLWCRPEALTPADMLGALASVLDVLIGNVGVRRIDAPISKGNTFPLRMLSLGGFVKEAELTKWRPLRGSMEDFEIYGLTREMWLRRRPKIYDVAPWDAVSTSLPILS